MFSIYSPTIFAEPIEITQKKSGKSITVDSAEIKGNIVTCEVSGKKNIISQ